MASIGREFVAAVVAAEDIEAFIRFGAIDHLFRPTELPLHEFVKGHVGKHGKLPAPETIEDETGEELPAVKEPPSYYYDKMANRHIEGVIKKANADVRDLLQPGAKDPTAALKVMMDAVFALSLKMQSNQIVDFREAYDLVWNMYVAKNKAEEGVFGLPFGWPTIDEMSGGGQPGDLISIVGRPQMGKTFVLLYIALLLWWKYTKPVIFFSMEMKPELILERLAAMQTHIKLTGLKKAFLSSTEQTKLKKGLTQIGSHASPLYIVDGNMASTVEDVYMLSRQLNPAAVFIDGGYLLKHPDPRLNRYQRVAENCDLLKQHVASDLGVPVFTTWQFSRDATKKKKGQKAGLEDIGYSDAIGQLSSVVLGLLEHDSIETLKHRTVDILKGRSGETGEFLINWDFDHMDFAETDQNTPNKWYI